MHEKKCRLSFCSVVATRRSLARLTREFYLSDPDDTEIKKFRAIVNAARAIIDSLRLEKELEVEQRIEELERMVKSEELQSSNNAIEKVME